MEEKWTNIIEPNIKNHYEISNLGRVRTKTNLLITTKNGVTKCKSPHILKETVLNGIPNVYLATNNSKSLPFPIEYLVCKCWLGLTSEIIEHIDGNVLNNTVNNLRLSTAFNNKNYDSIINLEEEEWKDIPGFEKMYQASTKGRIKSIARDIKKKNTKYFKPLHATLLSKSIDTYGYEIVSIKRDNETSFKTYKVHRLVALTFIPNIDNKPYVDHINHNRLDNQVSNLRWVTVEENISNGVSDSVIAIFPSGETKMFNSVKTASNALNLSSTTITSLCNRKGSKSKTGIRCIWTNSKQKRSKMAKRNKTKGNTFELEVINKLKAIGYSNCVSSRSQSKLTDDNKIDIIDLDNKLPINIQTKYTINFPNYFSIRDKCTDKTKPFGIVWKKTATSGSISPGIVAIIPFDFFCNLLKIN